MGGVLRCLSLEGECRDGLVPLLRHLAQPPRHTLVVRLRLGQRHPELFCLTSSSVAFGSCLSVQLFQSRCLLRRRLHGLSCSRQRRLKSHKLRPRRDQTGPSLLHLSSRVRQMQRQHSLAFLRDLESLRQSPHIPFQSRSLVLVSCRGRPLPRLRHLACLLQRGLQRHRGLGSHGGAMPELLHLALARQQTLTKALAHPARLRSN
mmetsp:Transcript_48590/g.114045  ORF Transcript_48590/g.114045 Transcript_48590/m.114045 type:complete len:205 (-) Transcript_48590:587-1201(-)